MQRLIQIVCLLLFSTQLDGKHIIGSQISYQYLGSNKYEVYTSVYRNCNECKLNGFGGGNNSNNCNEIADLQLWAKSGNSFILIKDLSNTRVKITDITALCAGERSKCNATSTVSYGLEGHLFKASLDLNSELINGYKEFKISITISSRSEEVNITGTAKSHFNFCIIDTKSGFQASSPSLNIIPFNQLKVNNGYMVSLAANGASYDSISYEFDTAYIGENSPNIYPTGISPTQPISVLSGNDPYIFPPKGITLDNKSGQIVFTPIMLNQIGVFVVKISFYKLVANKLERVGIIRRDFEYVTVNGSNPNPYFFGTSNIWNACENQLFQQDVYLKDDSFNGIFDTVKLEQNLGDAYNCNLIKDPLVKRPNWNHLFSWTPPTGSARNQPYLFNLSAKDSYCPDPGYASFAYQIIVEKAKIFTFIKTQINCDAYFFETTNFTTGDLVRLSIQDSNRNEVIGSVINNKDGLLRFPGRGKWYIRVIGIGANLRCATQLLDSVLIGNISHPKADLGNNLLICPNQTINLKANEVFVNGPIVFEWYINQVKIPKTNNQLDTIFDTNKTVKVKITDALNCFIEDSIQIIIKPKWNYTLKNGGLCVNFQNTLYLPNLISDTLSLTTLSFSGINIVNNRFSATNLSLGKYKAYFFATDTNFCSYSDSLDLEIGQPFKIATNTLLPICKNTSNLNLYNSFAPIPNNGTFASLNPNNIVLDSLLIMNNTFIGNNQIIYTGTRNGCSVDTQLTIEILAFPNITLISPNVSNICKSTPSMLITVAETGINKQINGNNVNLLAPLAYKDSAVLQLSKTDANTGCFNQQFYTFYFDDSINTKFLPIQNPICFDQDEIELIVSADNFEKNWSTTGQGGFIQLTNDIYKYTITALEKNSLSNIDFAINVKSNNICPDKIIGIKFTQQNKFDAQFRIIKEQYCEKGEVQLRINDQNILWLDSVLWFKNNLVNPNNGFSINEQYFNNLDAGTQNISCFIFKNGCFAQFDTIINIYNKPKAAVSISPREYYSARLPIVNFQILDYNPTHSYQWSSKPQYISIEGSNPYKFEMPSDTGTHRFKLNIISDKGCKDSAYFYLRCVPKDYIYIPNAFTPNNDGPIENNIFKPIGKVSSNYLCQIFNYWGEKVFESKDIEIGWDGNYLGKKCRMGGYLYKISFTDDIGRDEVYSGTLIMLP